MDVGSQLSTQVSSNWKWAEALDGSQTPAAFCLAHEAGLFGLLSHFVILENNAVQFRLNYLCPADALGEAELLVLQNPQPGSFSASAIATSLTMS